MAPTAGLTSTAGKRCVTRHLTEHLPRQKPGQKPIQEVGIFTLIPFHTRMAPTAITLRPQKLGQRCSLENIKHAIKEASTKITKVDK